MKSSQVEYLCLSSIIDYIYNKVINNSSYYDKDIEDFLAKTNISEKAFETIFDVQIIFNICLKYDVLVKYPGIMCRYHIKQLNKKFDLKFDNMEDLYYFLCDIVILEYNGYKKLIPIKAINNHYDIVKLFKDTPQLICQDCGYKIDKKISDKYYITNSSFGVCIELHSILCEDCLLSKKHKKI